MKRKRTHREREEEESESTDDKSKHLPFHGERLCAKSPACKNKAYWACPGDKFLCGVHSKKYAKSRRPLPKRSKTEAARIRKETMAAHMATVEAASKENRDAGRRGAIMLYRMRMMRTPPLAAGWLNVFPN